ncbi:YbaK/EbsC family protein [Actinomycetospora straminea]|uniref:YbaK/EbsC family protein n=1 Tax=Actinomycetospora straminea TaxID=663607 RepID=A0ABP9F9D0_9PSEU|nr:YbaK/EbsC family protein [Actinomycetospora straminea]MDD7936596.1 YbaK/EbsC family protein [Actinomycetospora straminea]
MEIGTTGRDAVRRALAAAGSPREIRTFDTAVPSAAAAAEQLGCAVGAIANSLVFTAGDGVVLVLASGAHRVDPGRVAAHLGVAKRRVKRADRETVLRATGQRVGGVAPVGHPAPLPCLVDVALTAHATVWAGAGDEHAMFPTTAEELVELTGGTLLEIAAG